LRCGCARVAHEEVGGGDAVALRHGVLDVLLARPNAVAARLPAVRRATAEEARAAGRTVCRRSDAHRRVPKATACIHGCECGPRLAALLAVEAGDGTRSDRRGPGEARVAERRVAHAQLGRAEEARHL